MSDQRSHPSGRSSGLSGKSGSRCQRHLCFGWWSLLCFLTIGLLLEVLHGLKVSWYLDPAFAIRRLVWTLGHAHGTLLALIHIAFAATIHMTSAEDSFRIRTASTCFVLASVLLPGGFLLGGIFLYSGDPGIGIFLVPAGAVCLFVAVFAVGLSTLQNPDSRSSAGEDPERK